MSNKQRDTLIEQLTGIAETPLFETQVLKRVFTPDTLAFVYRQAQADLAAATARAADHDA